MEISQTELLNRLRSRHANNRDMKIVITSHGNTTGTGKTTLAIQLCYAIMALSRDVLGHDRHWNAEAYSFMAVGEYLERYGDSRTGDVLLSDELEIMADNRRSMSKDNVALSQAWQMLRYKNVITVGTAPGIHALDKRVMENSDIWINVLRKGVAAVYLVHVDDFSGELYFEPMPTGIDGRYMLLEWDALEDTSDYQYLHDEKKEKGIPGIDMEETYDSDDLRKEKESAVKNAQKRVARNLLETGDYTQTKIAELTGLSQPTVSNLSRSA